MTAKIDPAARILRAPQVGAMLGISRASVYRRTADGSIPKPIKFGASLRWRTADIESLIAGTWQPPEAA